MDREVARLRWLSKNNGWSSSPPMEIEDMSRHNLQSSLESIGTRINEPIFSLLPLLLLPAGSNSRRSSRKRKERADDESLHSRSQKISSRADPTSIKRKFTPKSPSAPATVDTISSNLGNLSSKAAATARSISKLLGGEGWKSQSIGKLGLINTQSSPGLQALQRAIKRSIQIPQVAPSEAGSFNSDLVEAFIRAYHQRVSSSSMKRGERDFLCLIISDYEQANELLKGKIEQDGESQS